MMNPEVKEKWVIALTDGSYEQGHHILKKVHPYKPNCFLFCCLGVLSDIYQKEHPTIAEWYAPPLSKGLTRRMGINHPGGKMSESAFLLEPIVKWAGLEHANGGRVIIADEIAHLIAHNDGGLIDRQNIKRKTFDQIAAAISEQL